MQAKQPATVRKRRGLHAAARCPFTINGQALDRRCPPESAPAATMDMPMTAPTAAGVALRVHALDGGRVARAGSRIMGANSWAVIVGIALDGTCTATGGTEACQGLTN